MNEGGWVLLFLLWKYIINDHILYNLRSTTIYRKYLYLNGWIPQHIYSSTIQLYSEIFQDNQQNIF